MVIKTASLTQEVLSIIKDKSTEHPFTGEYDAFDKPGTFLCRQCGFALFRSVSKFHSGCGWASFDEEIFQHVLKVPDFDGQRVEILCHRCQAHLGHVFEGEGFTKKNIRHCVNSFSLDFISDLQVQDTEEAIFAAGCFWGVEYFFSKLLGVLKVESGYTGGSVSHPSYRIVCGGQTGHVEAVRVIFDPQVVSYEKLVQYFFEIHNFEQSDGQGPDRGEQYLSRIFFYDEEQESLAKKTVKTLQDNHYMVSTQLKPVSVFWRAEAYHQHYYEKAGTLPYCHTRTPISCFK